MVTVYLQIDNFLEIWIFGQNIARGVVFNLKNKSLKKTKYWWRNRCFTFPPEVQNYLLIDSPMMLCNQLTFAGLYRCQELATQLISHHANILLGVILLGMNKPRPWKCLWTSSKKPMSNERASKSWRKVEATPMGSSLQKIELRVKKDSTCSFWVACLLLSNPTCFSPTYHYELKSSWHFAWWNGLIAAWMFVHPTNTAVISDLKGFLINQNLFLTTSEYHYCIIKGESETCPILKSP